LLITTEETDDMCLLRPHLFNTSVATDTLTFCGDRRPENNQDQSNDVA